MHDPPLLSSVLPQFVADLEAALAQDDRSWRPRFTAYGLAASGRLPER